MFRKKGREEPKKVVSGRRFLRGAQVPDIEKIVSAREHRQMRSQSKKRARQNNILKFMRQAVMTLLILGLVALTLSRMIIWQVSLNATSYEAAVTQYFSDSPLQRLKPVFSKDKLQQFLVAGDPAIGSVDITTNLLSNSVSITIMQRQAVIRWIESNLMKSYLVDDQGIAFAAASDGSETDLLEIRDTSRIETSIGSNVIAPSSIQFILLLSDELQQLGFDTKAVVLTETPQVIRLDIANKPFDLVYTTSLSLEQQMSALKTFMDSQLSGEVQQYIDVRVPDKVFYK